MIWRALGIFWLVSAMLAAAACGAADDRGHIQSVPQAEATNVRRTAVAEVQRIIANPPAATPTPAATPIPRPACQGAIWWHEARAHLGEARMVQGTVVGARTLADGSGVLELGQPYPDPTGVAVLVRSAPSPSTQFTGKQVCIAGHIDATEGRPTMQLRDPSSIMVVN